MKRGLLWFMPDEWHAAKDDLRVRRRQERFRYWRTRFADPPEFNAALRADDRAAYRHNRRRALIIHERELGRKLFRSALKKQRQNRWILAQTPTRLKIIVAWVCGATITQRHMRKAIEHATRPVPEKRCYTQARNFATKP